MAITTFEAVHDVAVVGAVFSVAVPVGRERFPTAGAGKRIKGFAVDLVQMGVPPVSAAVIAAELHRLASRCLCQRLAAVTAAVRLRLFYIVDNRLA